MVKQSQDNGLIARYFPPYIVPAPVLLSWQEKDEQAPPTPGLTAGGIALLLTEPEDFLCLPIHHSQDLDYTSENTDTAPALGVLIFYGKASHKHIKKKLLKTENSNFHELQHSRRHGEKSGKVRRISPSTVDLRAKWRSNGTKILRWWERHRDSLGEENVAERSLTRVLERVRMGPGWASRWGGSWYGRGQAIEGVPSRTWGLLWEPRGHWEAWRWNGQWSWSGHRAVSSIAEGVIWVPRGAHPLCGNLGCLSPPAARILLSGTRAPRLPPGPVLCLLDQQSCKNSQDRCI